MVPVTRPGTLRAEAVLGVVGDGGHRCPCYINSMVRYQSLALVTALFPSIQVDALEERNMSTGLVTLCIGGGMGEATIFERV